MLTPLLEIRPGLTAVIGSGGKTTLLRTLGRELTEAGHRVLLCTTTKIFPFSDIETLISPDEKALSAALQQHRLVCAGAPVPGVGKLQAPEIPMARLLEMADYVIAEADGSAGKPLKAHAAHEPVIPRQANNVICVAGLSGLGQAIASAVHRPEIFAEIAGAQLTDPVTKEMLMTVLLHEFPRCRFLLNQADNTPLWKQGKTMAQRMDRPVVVASLQKGVYDQCSL